MVLVIWAFAMCKLGYEVACSEVEKFERVMNKVVKEWLGVPHWLSTAALYEKNIFTNDQLGGGVQIYKEQPGDYFY